MGFRYYPVAAYPVLQVYLRLWLDQGEVVEAEEEGVVVAAAVEEAGLIRATRGIGTSLMMSKAAHCTSCLLLAPDWRRQ